MTVLEVTTQLVHFDRARVALAEAHSIDEVKQIRDQAEAMRQYIRQQKGSLEMQNQAAEIKIRAERRAGEMLKGIEIKPGNPQLLHDVTIGITPKLEDFGITRIQSHRWQLEALVPEEKLEQFIAAAATDPTRRQELAKHAIQFARSVIAGIMGVVGKLKVSYGKMGVIGHILYIFYAQNKVKWQVLIKRERGEL